MRLTSLFVRLSARLVLWPLWGRSAYPAFPRGVMISHQNTDMEEIYMSRFYNNCVDEASLTTLCPICLDSFQGAKGVRVRRADPKQKIKDVCTYCQIRYGFDYYVQPDKNAGQYVKRGHFDDESECA